MQVTSYKKVQAGCSDNWRIETSGVTFVCFDYYGENKTVYFSLDASIGGDLEYCEQDHQCRLTSQDRSNSEWIDLPDDNPTDETLADWHTMNVNQLLLWHKRKTFDSTV